MCETCLPVKRALTVVNLQLLLVVLQVVYGDFMLDPTYILIEDLSHRNFYAYERVVNVCHSDNHRDIRSFRNKCIALAC